MINVPVYLAIQTDDPEVARDVALAVADNSPQLQDVMTSAGDVVIDYSIRIAGSGAPAPTLLKAESDQVMPRTYVTVPGLSLDIV